MTQNWSAEDVLVGAGAGRDGDGDQDWAGVYARVYAGVRACVYARVCRCLLVILLRSTSMAC